MKPLDAVLDLQNAGQFLDAFQRLESIRYASAERERVLALKSDLLQALGRLDEARAAASYLLRKLTLEAPLKSVCEYVLGRVARESADLEKAIGHFRRAASYAASGSKNRIRAEIALLNLVSNRSGSETTRPMIAELRAAVVKLGDPRVTAELHVSVGEIEARRGAIRLAERHARLALDVLQAAPSCWLEAVAENLLAAVCLMRSEFDDALKHAARCLDLAKGCGSASMLRASLGNLGNARYSRGDFDSAFEHFDHAWRSLPSDGETANWSFESMARVRLSQLRFEEVASLLGRIESSMRSPDDQNLHASRCAVLARGILAFRVGDLDSSISHLDDALQINERVADRRMFTQALLYKLECLARLSRSSWISDFEKAFEGLDGESPELIAQYERILAAATRTEDNTRSSRIHFSRAKRLCHALENVPAQLELEQLYPDLATADRAAAAPPAASPASVLHSVGCMIAAGSRPDIVGRELLAMLDGIGCVAAASLEAREPDATEVLDVRRAGRGGDAVPVRNLVLGTLRDREIALHIRPKADADSIAALNAAALLVNAIAEIQRARVEREERATLWPADELPLEGDRTVLVGEMLKQMDCARKVARAHVSVLVVGESGTGKEILAKAIHDYSNRADKPFVPVNCAAVPRDLLESHLFGHRRGAFTGAERDHSGFIRAADGGTLFLDEIGELGLDLQPKLLRFLESGEIAPLGEPSPMQVDVRIVAATNRNLEELVREGRFREDLFYRLNVVRLTLKPLRERRDEIPALVQHFVARAAAEFKKGQLTVGEETLERLLLYRWPGNVRQLQNEIRRIVALAEADSTIGPDDISEDILAALPLRREPPPVNGRELAVSFHEKLPKALARIEGELIKHALREHRGRVDAAARALGISRKGLYLKRQRLGL